MTIQAIAITTETPPTIVGLDMQQLADIEQRLDARTRGTQGGPVDQDIRTLLQHNTYACDLLLRLWEQAVYHNDGSISLSMMTGYNEEDDDILNRIRAYLGVD